MSRHMRLASLLSGGKDSVRSIQLALDGGHIVPYAVTIFPERNDSYMFHVPDLWLTSLQAASMGITHIRRDSSGRKEDELSDLKEALRPLDVDGVLVGAIASNYQLARVTKICAELGLEVMAPLWGADPESLLRQMLEKSYCIVIVGVYADGMGPEWLGRIVDSATLDDLKRLQSERRINMSFEGGEAETLVLDCPLFSSRIVIDSAEVSWETCRGEYLIKQAHLEKKPGPAFVECSG